ncbi:MAG: hypothetical protein ACLT98_03810 [Eggerthellaceae bacterium]
MKLLTVYGKRDAAGRARTVVRGCVNPPAGILYACGARVSEASGLLAANVDSKRR